MAVHLIKTGIIRKKKSIISSGIGLGITPERCQSPKLGVNPESRVAFTMSRKMDRIMLIGTIWDL
ncbi:hypothetical protein B2I00_16995 [Morganella morganii]|nr:hypothetical protein B2I00_16995 [Morganella morganii]